MKESAIDCNLHKSSDEKDKYTCFSYNSANINNYLYAPSIYEDEEDLVSKLNEEVVKLKAKKITLGAKEYAITDDLKLYDFGGFYIKGCEIFDTDRCVSSHQQNSQICSCLSFGWN